MTYADLKNGLGVFASGAGPGSLTTAPLSGTSILPSGTRTLTVVSRPASVFQAIVTKGPRQFGGTMRLLGGTITTLTFTSPAFPSGVVTVPSPTTFPTAQGDFATDMGKRTFIHTVMSSITQMSWITGWGFPWTTGSVTAIARTGSASTSSTAQGFDTLTPAGHRNIQMVAPTLVVYTATVSNAHSNNGGTSVANFTFATAPEPGVLALLGFGACTVCALHWIRRRKRN
jgi:hypothetical protein